NFEQVEDAAPQVAELLAACLRLKVLATSRTPLEVYGEREYPLQPLPLPAANDSASTESPSSFAAIRLFVDRAIEVKPSFALTPAPPPPPPPPPPPENRPPPPCPPPAHRPPRPPHKFPPSRAPPRPPLAPPPTPHQRSPRPPASPADPPRRHRLVPRPPHPRR